MLLSCLPALFVLTLPASPALGALTHSSDVPRTGTLGQIQNHPDHPAASLTNETGIIALDLSYLQNELTREVAQSSLHSSRLAGPFAIKALSTIADLLIGEVVGIGTGALVDVLFGKDVPVNLAELFDDALKEVDRIVGDQIAAAFTARKKEDLQSLTRLMREYSRSKHLRDSRNEIRDLLATASDLFSFFEGNGVVTNSAYQVTASLRLGLLLEAMHLDQLLEESQEKVESGRENIRAQASDARLALEHWAATYRPTEDTTKSERTYLSRCVDARCHGRSPYRNAKIKVCMVLESPGLRKPSPLCFESEGSQCKSDHIREVIRKRRLDRCLNKIEAGFKANIEKHVRDVAMPQFRERNEAEVFGEDFRGFLQHLKDVENLDFADVTPPALGA